MAKEPKDYKLAEHSWSGMEVLCPICNKTFRSWYCPKCGLPKNNSAFHSEKDIFYKCGQNHFRRIYDNKNEYQLCFKCFAPNPFNAQYCKSCGESMSTQARDKHGNGWVDLGLSVLWASELIGDMYIWNYPERSFSRNPIYTDSREITCLEIKERKDVATKRLGVKWRTPTREEFEELILKCKWEKCLKPNTNEHAFKVIGPNGNSIIIPVVGGRYGGEDLVCLLWTSSKDKTEHSKSFAFVYNEGINLRDSGVDFSKYIDCKRRTQLWLETPVKMHFNEEISSRNTIKSVYNLCVIGILPVADKKWIGNL